MKRIYMMFQYGAHFGCPIEALQTLCVEELSCLNRLIDLYRDSMRCDYNDAKNLGASKISGRHQYKSYYR